MKRFNIARLRDHVDQFDRVQLGHLPTPLEPVRRLITSPEAPRIFIKRDDATGLGGCPYVIRQALGADFG